MKQMIILMAVLPILLVFVLQFSVQEQRRYEIARGEALLAVSIEKAKMEGGFTLTNKSQLLGDLAKLFQVTRDEIQMDTSSSVKYRQNSAEGIGDRGEIPYKIIIPIKKVMAGASLFGISEEENRGQYVMEGTFASERLMP